MRNLFRRYVHSKLATVVGVLSGVLSILCMIAAVISMVICVQTEMWQWMASFLACVAGAFLSYVGLGRVSEYIALHALEKKLGKRITRV